VTERDEPRSEGYEPPKVEEVPATDAPAVTAAGESPIDDGGGGPEWRPAGDVDR
jgi:hypothetical protein